MTDEKVAAAETASENPASSPAKATEDKKATAWQVENIEHTEKENTKKNII